MIKQCISLVLSLFVANSYANDSTTLLVGFQPGGGNYTVAKIVADSATRLGHPVILEIKAGAGGIIGMNDCVARVSEKNLICMASQAQYVQSLAVSTEIRKFDPRELTFVKAVGYSPILLVTGSKNTKPIPEILTDLKTGKKTSFAIGALGLKVSTNWFLKEVNAIGSVMVDYKGAGPAIIDVIAGHVDYAFVPYVAAAPQIKAGLLRVIASSGKVPAQSNFVKLQKFVPSMPEDNTIFGFVMGPGASKETVNFYDKLLTRVLNDAETKAQLEMQNILPYQADITSEQFRNLALDEIRRVGPMTEALAEINKKESK